MKDEPAPDPFKPLTRQTGWAWVRRLAGRLLDLFGPPKDLAERSLGRDSRDHLRDALLSLETLVRQLLFLEAALLPKPRPKKQAPSKLEAPRKPAPPPSALAAVARKTAPDPNSGPRIRSLDPYWTPSYRPPPPPPEPVIPAKAGTPAPRKTHPPRFQILPPLARIARKGGNIQRTDKRPQVRPESYSARRLARRLEALIHALENPKLYARRLARRLRGMVGLVRIFTFPPPRLNPHAPGSGFVLEAHGLVCETAERVFEDTS